MEKELSLRIEFSKDLSEKEQMTFWNSIVEEIEKLGLLAGGGHNSKFLDWVIDCSNSSFEKHEIIDEIGDFLLDNDDKVLNFEIK